MQKTSLITTLASKTIRGKSGKLLGREKEAKLRKTSRTVVKVVASEEAMEATKVVAAEVKVASMYGAKGSDYRPLHNSLYQAARSACLT